MGTTKTPTELAGLRILGAAGVAAGANQGQMDGASGWLVIKTKEDPTVGTTTIDQTEYDALVAKAAKLDDIEKAGTGTDANVDPVAKALEGLPEEVRKAVDAKMAGLQKAADAAAAQAVAATEAVEKSRVERATADAEALAKSWDSLPVDATEFAPAFVKLADASPEMGEFVRKMLAAANEAAKVAAITKAAGRDGRIAVDNGSDPFMPIAKALQEKDPTLTKQGAYAKAVEENPGLYAKHRDANVNRVNAE